MPSRAPSRPWLRASLAVLLAAVLLAWVWSARLSEQASVVLSSGFRKVLILTAHPDDETMFFAPTILHLIAAGVQVHGLCLSIGNADGIGRKREGELRAAYSVLGVPSSRVAIVDDPLLQDGMGVDWDPHLVLAHTAEAILHNDIDSILTFDSAGISKHPNHIALYRAVSNRTRIASILRQQSLTLPELDMGFVEEDGMSAPSVWTLRTPPLWQKFLGLPMALTSYTHHLRRQVRASDEKAEHAMAERLSSGELQFFSSPSQYLKTLRAMRAHSSQLVWFRYLYVLFSTLMYSSSIRRLS